MAFGISSAANNDWTAHRGCPAFTLNQLNAAEDNRQRQMSQPKTVAKRSVPGETQLKKFVDAYNKMMDTVSSLTKVTSCGGR